MKKKLQIRKDGKARFALQDGSMVTTRWFKSRDAALLWLGKKILAEAAWVTKLKWRQPK